MARWRRFTTRTDPQSPDAVLHLIDLRSGTEHATSVTVSGDQDPSAAMVWAPDSRWLFVVDAARSITAVDRAGHARTLDSGLPPIEQLAMR
jgi:hypothetical protein